MIFLASTSDLISVVTDASASVEVHADWLDFTIATGAIAAGRTNTPAIGSATTTTIVGSPASGVVRSIQSLTLNNAHASTSVTVTIQHTDGTNAEILMKCILLADDTLQLDANGRWTHLASNGEEIAFVNFFGTRAETEAGTTLLKPINAHNTVYHPGQAKAWANVGVSFAQIWDLYNINNYSDTGAGQVTLTISTDFSSANYAAFVMGERASTALAVTNLINFAIRNAGQAAGTILLEAWDNSAGSTATQEDPVQWCFVAFGTLV